MIGTAISVLMPRCKRRHTVVLLVFLVSVTWIAGSTRAIQGLKHAQMGIKQCFAWFSSYSTICLPRWLFRAMWTSPPDDNLARIETLYNLRVSGVPK